MCPEGNLTFPWKMFVFSAFMGIFFCMNSFIGELLWHFRIYGHDFQKILQKFLRIYGYTFEKFLRIYGWYFYDLMAQPRILETQVTPPPPGSRVRSGHGASRISILFILTDKPGNIQFTTPTLKPQNGNPVKLSCSSNAVPTPTYRIYKIIGSSSTVISNSGSHTIASINYVDFNGYKATLRCQSSNSFGNATKDIQLDIQGIISEQHFPRCRIKRGPAGNAEF